MTAQQNKRRLQSWIPPAITWVEKPDVFCVEVPTNDPDVVEFMSTGYMNVDAHTRKQEALMYVFLFGEEKPLLSRLIEAVWVRGKLKPPGNRTKPSMSVTAYCHGVFLLPDKESITVLVSNLKPENPQSWFSEKLRTRTGELMERHQVLIAQLAADEAQKKIENQEFLDRLPAQNREQIAGVFEANASVQGLKSPILTIEPLLDDLPEAVIVQIPSTDILRIERSAIAAIAGSNIPPSRDGSYMGILLKPVGRKTTAIVSWVPHTGLPSYPEIRWAVQRRLPAAMRKPRILTPGSPKFDSATQSIGDSVQVCGFDPDSPDLRDALEDLQLDQIDFRGRVDKVRKGIKAHGFEAIAWFQPYHIWTEDTWGIYFDAQKLDDLACSFLDDFRAHHVQAPHSLAALLAFGLTYAHELFHARVEATTSWQELNALQPRHLRYKQRVYDALRETTDWLEEALANWSAWDWFHSDATQKLISLMTSHIQGLERVVEASMDLSPPGYQQWRLGDQKDTWRTFATQISTGNTKLAPPGIGLPIESVLNEPLPYDFLATDIPLRFVGQGVIADRLQSHPATFNVPTRREIEKALRYFKHILDSSGGKGGHQKWTGPDQRAFILPTRDPVSAGVFKTFLHHLGIDKATYVRQVRPNL